MTRALRTRAVMTVLALSFAGAFVTGACGSDSGGSEPGATGSSTASSSSSSGSASGSASSGGSSGSSSSGSSGGDSGADAAPTTPLAISRLSASRDAACVISDVGALRCWGAFASPQAVSPAETFKRVSVADVTTPLAGCAIRSDDTLWCWSGSSFALTQAAVGTFRDISVSSGNQCAVTTTGSLVCWGSNNSYGILATGDTSARPTPNQVGSDLDWERVVVGQYHACAIKSSGALWCWGIDNYGQLGDGGSDSGNGSSPSPVPVAPGTVWLDVDVEPGGTSTCAIRSDHRLLCWGTGLVVGGGIVKTPAAIDAATDWARVRLGLSPHACALKTDGRLHCWGYNSRGQLGTGDFTTKTSPQQLGSAPTWNDVAVGAMFACASKPDGTVHCWGSNNTGELGQATAGHLAPTRIGAAGGWASVDASSLAVCATRKNGTLACWGFAGNTQQGIFPGPFAQAPLAIGTGNMWANVAVSEAHACARTTSGALHCWGRNDYGQVGVSGASVYALPTPVGLTASTMGVGASHTCAVASADGSLYCWGRSDSNQTGLGTTNVAIPTKVGMATWSAVAGDALETCGIQTDSTLWCWGGGFPATPDKRGSSTSWTAIEGNTAGAFFEGVDGSTFSTVSSSAINVRDAGTVWVSVGAGMYHRCGIKNDSTLWCIGTNSFGECGDGMRTFRATFGQVGGANDWVKVTAGYSFTCGIRGAGDLYCWGSNEWGTIGDGTAFGLAPMQVQ